MKRELADNFYDPRRGRDNVARGITGARFEREKSPRRSPRKNAEFQSRGAR